MTCPTQFLTRALVKHMTCAKGTTYALDTAPVDTWLCPRQIFKVAGWLPELAL